MYAVDVNLGDGLKELEGAQTSTLDVTAADSIQKFKDSIGNEPIDLLLNVAGIAARPDNLEDVSLPDFQRVFSVNTYGPMFLTQALLPNILASSTPKIGIVTSRMGSVGDNSSGGMYAYRASKAAVNSVGKSMAMDLKSKGVTVMLLHPGPTMTNIIPEDMIMPGMAMPDEVAEKLWKVVSTVKVEDTGKFWHRDGYELPW